MPIRLPTGVNLVSFVRRLGAQVPPPLACWRQPDGAWIVSLDHDLAEKPLWELGAQAVVKPSGKPDRGATAWPELVPLESAPLPDPWDSPTLIMVADRRAASKIAGNIIALGHDGSRLGRLGPEEDARWVILGTGMPLFVLLGLVNSGLASVLVAPGGRRVWFPAGFRHPLETSIHADPGKWVLCHGDLPWETVAEPVLEEIERHTRFHLGPTVAVEMGQWTVPVEVPMRLERRVVPEQAVAWWYPGEDMGEFERWVARVPVTELSNYLFAVVTSPEPGVMLRWRPIARRGRTEPPPMSIPLAILQGMDGIYLPCDRRIVPLMAPTMLRRAFQARPGVIRIVLPAGEGDAFRVLALPEGEGDFRLLDHWVRYVIHQDSELVSIWREQHRFDFDSFIVEAPPVFQPGPVEPGTPQLVKTGEMSDIPVPKAKRGRPRKTADAEVPAPAPVPVLEQARTVEPPVPEKGSGKRQEMEERRKALALAFWETEGPLLTPKRLGILNDLAMIEGAMGNVHEAAKLMAVAAWQEESRENWRALFAHEMAVHGLPANTVMEGWVPDGTPGRHWAVWVAGTRPESMPELVASYLRESCRQAAWPIRHVWWAAREVSRVSGGDLLLVAEARDRVVRRLVEDLRLTGDMPFLMTERVGRSGAAGREAQVAMIGPLVSTFLAECESKLPRVGRGADVRQGVMVLGHAAQAIGLALLGEVDSSQVMERALEWDRSVPKVKASPLVKAVSLALQAYSHRFRQASGGGLSGPLPAELEPAGKTADAGQLRYMYLSFREMSRLLEPDQHVNPFAAFLGNIPPCLQELRSAQDESAAAKAFDDCLKALSAGALPAQLQSLILSGTMERAVSMDETRAARALAALVAHVGNLEASKGVPGLDPWVLLATGSRLACQWNLMIDSLQSLMIAEVKRLVARGMQGCVSVFLSRVARRMLACGRRADLKEITGAIREARQAAPPGGGVTLDRERSGLALEAHLETVELAGGQARDESFWARLEAADFSRPPADLQGRDATVGLLDALLNLRSAVDDTTGKRMEPMFLALMRSLAGEAVTAAGMVIPGCLSGVLRGIEVLAAQPMIGSITGRDSWIMDETEASLRARVFREFAEAMRAGGMS